MWDTLIVTLIVACAAGYLIRRQLTKKSSDGCGCSGGSGCGGCGSARQIRTADKHESKTQTTAPQSGGCCCGSGGCK